MLPFLNGYLWARDGVSCDVLARETEAIEAALAGGEAAAAECSEFWQIVGLIECGCVGEAYERVRQFKPKDKRYLLALHLGSFVYSHQRVVQGEERRLAERMCKFLAPEAQLFFGSIRKELKAEMSRLRAGEDATSE